MCVVVALFLRLSLSGSALLCSPCRYLDADNHFHAVFHHCFQCPKPCVCGGHAYSLDSVTWYYPYINGSAYFEKVNLTDGRALEFHKRERPHLVFAKEDGVTPIALTTGSGIDGIGKYTDHTWTFLQPIKRAAAAATADDTVSPSSSARMKTDDGGAERDKRGRTELMRAAAGGDTDRVAALLRTHGIDPNLMDMNGMNALHIAAEAGSAAVVGLLLAAPSIGLNARDDGGYTALHYAAYSGHTEIVAEILSEPRFTKLEAKTSVGFTALDNARGMGHAATVAVLEEAREL